MLSTEPGEVQTDATVLSDGSLAFILGTTTLTDLDPTNGTTAWSLDLGAPTMLYPPVLVEGANGTVYVAHHDKIQAVSTTTRKVAWTVPTIANALVLDERDQRLYFLYDDGAYSKIGSLSAIDGTGLAYSSYVFEAGNSPSALALGDDGWVYFIGNGQLHGIDTTSQKHWELPVLGTCSSPVVGGDGTVYFAETSSKGVAAVAVTGSGTLRWRKTLRNLSTRMRQRS